jgi:hypothetical protein
MDREAKTFWPRALEMSRAIGGLNEIFIYGRSLLREV